MSAAKTRYEVGSKLGPQAELGNMATLNGSWNYVDSRSLGLVVHRHNIQDLHSSSLGLAMAQFAVKALDHVVLTCRSIPKTVDFYTSRLGMKHEKFTSGGGERYGRFGSNSRHITSLLFLPPSLSSISSPTPTLPLPPHSNPIDLLDWRVIPADMLSSSATKSSTFTSQARSSSQKQAMFNLDRKTSASSPTIPSTKSYLPSTPRVSRFSRVAKL